MLNTSLFKKQSTVAVALSGGKDSVCLINMLLEKAASLGITVKAINVEHGIRGENSLRDTAFVKKLCESKNVPLLCFAVDSPARAEQTGESLEQAARFLRYDCFKKAISSGFCDFIATAHHQSDNAETVLLNLLRGTSLKGLCGIKKTALSGQIIRPLLSVSREELDEYALKNNLEYVVDETNFLPDFSRNYLRNEVIPLIKRKFPHFERAAARMCKNIESDDQTLDYYAQKLILPQYSPTENKENEISVKICGENERAIFMRACVIAFKRLGFVADYTSAHLDALYNLCFLQTGSSVNMKNGIKAFKEHGRIIFCKENHKCGAISLLSALSANESGKKETDNTGNKTDAKTVYKAEFLKNDASDGIYFGDYKISLLPIKNKPRFNKADEIENDSKSKSKGEFIPNNEIYFDFDKLPDQIEVRTRETGDEIVTFGGKIKSLKKYLNDKKISARISNGLPLIAKGKNVFLVAKVDVSALLKIDESTRNIVKFKCTTKEND
ncbi:MAG: tRNA lysidine(34) synthetase TilS [Candidatus Borkfalkiaceae bacterium]|nr:tRNA lysidine(34) synthetase TilS [Christensenellaceae bacterium]